MCLRIKNKSFILQHINTCPLVENNQCDLWQKCIPIHINTQLTAFIVTSDNSIIYFHSWNCKCYSLVRSRLETTNVTMLDLTIICVIHLWEGGIPPPSHRGPKGRTTSTPLPQWLGPGYPTSVEGSNWQTNLALGQPYLRCTSLLNEGKTEWGMAQCSESPIFRKIVRNIFTPTKLSPPSII